MYFPVFQHYLMENYEELESRNKNRLEINENDKNKDVCIICLEINDIMKAKQLFIIEKYNIQCNCNYYIHKVCFEEWIRIRKSCPICKSNFSEIETL